MPKSHRPYPPEFRQRIIDLVRKGRPLEELGRQFEPSAQAIRNWVQRGALRSLWESEATESKSCGVTGTRRPPSPRAAPLVHGRSPPPDSAGWRGSEAQEPIREASELLRGVPAGQVRGKCRITSYQFISFSCTEDLRPNASSGSTSEVRVGPRDPYRAKPRADERRRTPPFLTPDGILMVVGDYNCKPPALASLPGGSAGQKQSRARLPTIPLNRGSGIWANPTCCGCRTFATPIG